MVQVIRGDTLDLVDDKQLHLWYYRISTLMFGEEI